MPSYSLTWQNDSSNRRVPLVIQRGAFRWDVTVSPNPADPDDPAYDTAAAAIRIVNPANPAVPVNLSDVRLSIFDAVGNTVLRSAPFEKSASGTVFWWKGNNRKGRKVANGTYIGVVTVNDEGARGVRRVKIGILRGRATLTPLP